MLHISTNLTITCLIEKKENRKIEQQISTRQHHVYTKSQQDTTLEI